MPNQNAHYKYLFPLLPLSHLILSASLPFSFSSLLLFSSPASAAATSLLALPTHCRRFLLSLSLSRHCRSPLSRRRRHPPGAVTGRRRQTRRCRGWICPRPPPPPPRGQIGEETVVASAVQGAVPAEEAKAQESGAAPSMLQLSPTSFLSLRRRRLSLHSHGKQGAAQHR